MNWKAKLVTLNDKALWQQLLDKIEKKDIHFTPEYMICFEEIFGKAYLFFYGDEDNYIVYPFFKREINNLPFFKLVDSKDNYYDITSPWYFGGPLIFSDKNTEQNLFENFLDELHSYCIENNIITEFSRFHPTLKNHTQLMSFESGVEKLYDVWYIDLRQNEEVIWKNFKKSCRNAITAAQRRNVKIRCSNNTEDIQSFYNLYIQTMNKIGVEEFYFFEFNFFEKLFAILKDNLILFTASFEEKPIAASLFLFKYGIVHYWLSGSDANYRNLYPNNLLLYKAILWAKEQDNNLFLLMGGSSPELRKFKSSFSTTAADFYIHKKVHNEAMYKLLCEKKIKYNKENDITKFNQNYFPMYRG